MRRILALLVALIAGSVVWIVPANAYTAQSGWWAAEGPDPEYGYEPIGTTHVSADLTSVAGAVFDRYGIVTEIGTGSSSVSNAAEKIQIQRSDQTFSGDGLSWIGKP